MIVRPARPTLADAVKAGALALTLSAIFGLRPRDRALPASGDGRSSTPPSSASTKSAGRGADTPAEIPAQGWWAIAKRLYGQIDEDRILAVAAGVTFYGLLALFPAVGAFVALYGLVADPGSIGEHLADLGTFLPGGVIDMIGDQIKRLTSKPDGALGLAFFTGLGVSLWSANAGVKAVFDALNVAYDTTEKRNFFVLNACSLLFTLGTIALLVAALGGIVVVPVVLTYLGLGGAVDWLLWLGRWPAMLGLVLLGLALLYRYGPSRENARWRWITPGAILAGCGWLLFSLLFSWYVSNFGTYNETYGSLGAAIGFMTWTWLSTTIVLVGAELNSEIEHQAGADRPGA